jgi:ribosomal protein S18 acetylase RimI-like enzyme
MSRYRFEVAGPGDDADLRRVLAGTPMPGRIALAFRREPSYFAAAVVDGRFRQVVAARDGDSGRIVGFGSRSVGERYVNGRPEAVGYLSGLRLLPEYRRRGLVARGYAFFRRLHADGRTRLYLTTIAEDNTAARDLLTSGRAGLPGYHEAGRYHTVALPLAGRARPQRPPPGLEVRPAEEADLPAVLAFLEAEGPRRQFFPCYRTVDLFTAEGALRGLRAEDLLLAFHGGRLVGTLGGWDQFALRQTVVHGYGRLLGRVRPIYNAWARWRGRPRLPAPGEVLRYLTAALPVVAGDDAGVFAALLDALRGGRAAGPWEYLLVGLHEADPLLRVLRACPGTWYTTRLYLVCWEDGDERRRSLDSRPPYLELGSL